MAPTISRFVWGDLLIHPVPLFALSKISFVNWNGLLKKRAIFLSLSLSPSFSFSTSLPSLTTSVSFSDLPSINLMLPSQLHLHFYLLPSIVLSVISNLSSNYVSLSASYLDCCQQSYIPLSWYQTSLSHSCILCQPDIWVCLTHSPLTCAKVLHSGPRPYQESDMLGHLMGGRLAPGQESDMLDNSMGGRVAPGGSAVDSSTALSQTDYKW